MHVRVGDIKPNPFRNISKYPINRERVEALKASIKDTEFWDNILLRASVDHYQLAYGHHRLVALKELGIEAVNVPVKEINDATMLRIMANENMNDWSTTPAVVNETIGAVKSYLDKMLKSSKSCEEFYQAACLGSLVVTGFKFEHLKQKGVGRELIFHFLNGYSLDESTGKTPLWPKLRIENSLQLMKDEADLLREAENDKRRAAEEKKAAEIKEKEEQKKLDKLREEQQKAFDLAANMARQEREKAEEERAKIDEKIKLKKEKEAEKFAQAEADRKDIELERKRIAKEKREAEKKANALLKRAELAEKKAEEARERRIKADKDHLASIESAKIKKVEAGVEKKKRSAAEMFDTMAQAKIFKASAARYKIPVERQKDCADYLKKNGYHATSIMDNELRQYAIRCGFYKKPIKSIKEGDKKDLNQELKEIAKLSGELNRRLTRIKPFFNPEVYVNPFRAFSLYTEMRSLNNVIEYFLKLKPEKEKETEKHEYKQISK